MGNCSHYKYNYITDIEDEERKCLKCNKVFTSKNGYRICPNCNAENKIYIEETVYENDDCDFY